MTSLKSVWNHFAEMRQYPSLQNDISVDVAVIGAGITGVTAGKLLAESGISTAVLESHSVGSGTTSHSTGNLYFTVDGHLSAVESKYDIDTVKAVTESRWEALRQIQQWVQDLALDCDFKIVPWHLYSSDSKNKDIIRKELQAGQRAELPVSAVTKSKIPFPMTDAITIPDQAQINPMRYVQELAATVNSDHCQIYEQTRVSSVKKDNGKYRLQTSSGTITADKVIHATHSPKGIKFVQTLLGPYREYGIACRIESINHPEGIFWGLYDEGTVISTRIYRRNDEAFLIVVGKPHKVGHKEHNEQVIESLEAFARDHFPIKGTAFRWGGQHYRPADLLPFIGPVKKESREFIATGYSTDGLIYGTLAAMIIADQIAGKQNKWYDLYDATRKQPLKSGPKFLKENLDVASHYLKDLTGIESTLEDLKTGDGKIIKKEGKRLAVHRNENGELEVVSAVCTHMGCNVRWNNAEKTWDCPCHGSRFDTDGSVIEGPAFQPLQKNPVIIP